MRNNLKHAFRYLWRNKTSSLLNIAGLSLGITSALLLYLFIRQELSYDTFHAKKDRIYRVINKIERNGEVKQGAGSALILGGLLRTELPQVEKSALTYYLGGGSFVINPENTTGELKKIKLKEGVSYVQPEFYEIFDFRWTVGSYKEALSKPNSVVISESMAEKFFGVSGGHYNEAIGKTLKFNNSILLTVNGIIKDPPANSDFPFKVVISEITNYNNHKDDYGTWFSVDAHVNFYVLLRKGFAKKDFEERLTGMVYKQTSSLPEETRSYFLQPLSDLHFNSELGNYNRTINKKILFALCLVAGLLLFAACINFINLSTAQAVKRSKEVGIKKMLGAGRASLFSYFMGEVALIVSFSAAFAIVLTELFTPYISKWLKMNIEYNSVTDYEAAGFLLAISAAMIIIAGAYPSLLISKSSPIKTMKGGLSGGNKGGLLLRRSLVVTQFVIAQGLIIGALVINSQMEYFKTKELGYDKDLLIQIDFPKEGYKQKDFIRDKLMQLPNIKNVSVALNPPSSITGLWITSVSAENNPDMPIAADMKPADVNYIKTYNLKLMAGRDLLETDGFDRIIINESMMEKIGIKDPAKALGYTFQYVDNIKLEVAGVVKNFYLRSLLNEKIDPVIIFNAKPPFENMLLNAGIKLKKYGSQDEMEKTISGIQQVWNSAFPTEVFDYEFLDKALYGKYRDVERTANIIMLFTFIAVLIGCLGLYGLITFIAVQKTKEIGVRKVLGSSVSGIVALLSREFMILMGISFLISWPAAYFLMNKWLEDYPQRISVGFGIFFSAAAITFFISAVTISYQAIKAATANPVKSLKYE